MARFENLSFLADGSRKNLLLIFRFMSESLAVRRPLYTILDIVTYIVEIKNGSGASSQII